MQPEPVSINQYYIVLQYEKIKYGEIWERSRDVSQ